MEIAVQIVSWLLMTTGGFFVFVGGIGVLRLPNFYTRLHAAGLGDSAGTVLIMAGVMLQLDTLFAALKAAGILLFLILTGPTATYAVANAALSSGLRTDAKPYARESEEDAP